MRDLTKLSHVVRRLPPHQVPPSFNDPDMDPTKNGAFMVQALSGVWLRVLATTGYGWEHVSVSIYSRTPNWGEMDQVKRLFFEDTETVVQYHVPSSDHINDHPYCLHLWRPTHREIPRPPGWMVGGSTPEQAGKEMALLDFETGEPLAKDESNRR